MGTILGLMFIVFVIWGLIALGPLGWAILILFALALCTPQR